MGLRSYFGFGAGRDDRAEQRFLSRQNLPSIMLGGPGDPAITPTSALSIGDCFACVRLLAESAAILPLHTYRRTSSGRERTDGQTTQLLLNPAPATTTPDLIGQMVSHLALWGSAFVGKYKQDGRVTQLGLLDPARMTVEIRAGRPRYTLYRTDGEQQPLTTDDVIHVRTSLSLDGITGLSPIRQARTALGLAKSLAEHGQAVMANGGLPAGVLKVQTFGTPAVGQEAPDGSPTELTELRDAWSTRHEGTANAGRIAVLSGEVDFVPLSVPLEDLLFVDQRRLSTVEIARLFRVPARMVNASSGDPQTYSNVESQSLDFVKFTMQPYLTVIERSLSADTDLFPRNGYCAFAIDALLRGDSASRAAFFTAGLDPLTGWLSRDEVRALEDLPPETVHDAPAPARAGQSVEEPA